MGSRYWRSTEYILAWFVFSKPIYFLKVFIPLLAYVLYMYNKVTVYKFSRILKVFTCYFFIMWLNFLPFVNVDGNFRFEFFCMPNFNVITLLRSRHNKTYQLEISCKSSMKSENIYQNSYLHKNPTIISHFFPLWFFPKFS